MANKYIQSFYQYPVTFSSIGKGIPAKNADGELGNLVEVTEAELQKLQQSEPMFRALINQKKYRILNRIPESYKPAAQKVNEAQSAVVAAEERAAAAEARIAELEAKLAAQGPVKEVDDDGELVDVTKLNFKELEKLAADMGIGKQKSKADYIKAIQEKQGK